jgi:hypothetical protein
MHLLSAAAAQPTQIKFNPAKTRIEWTLGCLIASTEPAASPMSATRPLCTLFNRREAVMAAIVL